MSGIRRAVLVGVVSATVAAGSAVGAQEQRPPTSAVRAACADTKDVYQLHMSVGSVLDVDEYVETIRGDVRPKTKRLRRAFAEYDRARSQAEYEHALRHLIAWCTATYGPLK